MQVPIFGAASSPNCTSFRLNILQLTTRNMQFGSETFKTVKRNFYVDDSLTSSQSVAKAKRLVRQLTALLMLGGFHLTKWVSNNLEVLATIPNEEKAASVINIESNQPYINRANPRGVMERRLTMPDEG